MGNSPWQRQRRAERQAEFIAQCEARDANQREHAARPMFLKIMEADASEDVKAILNEFHEALTNAGIVIE